MYRHSGPLFKGQRGGGNKVYRNSVHLSKGERGGGSTVYTHSGPLTKGQRGHGRQYINTQDLYPNVRGRWETVYSH